MAELYIYHSPYGNLSASTNNSNNYAPILALISIPSLIN